MQGTGNRDDNYGKRGMLVGNGDGDGRLNGGSEGFESIALEHTGALLWLADDCGQLVYGNAAFCREFGIDGISGAKKVQEVIPGDMAAFFLEKHRRVRQSGGSYCRVHQFTRPDGTYSYFLITIYTVGGAGRIHPVGGAGSASRPLTGGEAWDISELSAVNPFSSDAIWEWNIETGQIYRNQALQRLIGFALEKTENLSWWLQRVHPEDRGRVQCSLEEIITNKGGKWHEDYRFKSADDVYINVADRGYVQYRNGRPTRMIGSLQNISEVRELEARLKEEKMQHELKIAETIVKVQEQERTYIGHELHDNVCQILISARLYLDGLNPKTKEEKQIKLNTSDLILSAVQEIRGLSHKLAATQLRSNGLITSIQQLLNDIRNSGQFNIKFSSTVDIDTEYSMSEEKKVALFRIVQEEMNNIIRHSRAKNVRVSIMQNNSGVILYTFDDGVGFDLPHVKQGMGLANIHSRAKLFNGVVDILTAPGMGCSVTVLMPYE
jgi:PAS domain S-box-containing protein